MRFDWDDAKSEKLKRERGISLGEAAEVFASYHVVDQKNDDPEQYYAIGFVHGRFITLIYEYREDALGELKWLVTYWPSTAREREIYEKAIR